VGPTLSVASFNVHWGLRPDGSELELEAALTALDADVVALQEVWSRGPDEDALGAAATALGYERAELALSELGVRETASFASSALNGVGRWGIAVLSRVGPGQVSHIPLGRGARDPVPRTALRVDFTIEGQPVVFVAAHLSHRVWAAPVQLRRLRRALHGEGAAVVVAGDFNCVGPVARAALLPLRPAARGRTWPATRPVAQLDHLFVGGGVQRERGSVLADLGSDHLPVRAELRLAC
jgi:endonuclease/exonuclease/phosphatase family metal-dependent hydrolase